MSATPTTTPITIPATMRAITQDAYGTADVLLDTEVAVPAIGDDQVLVRVQAAGVDRGTWHCMTGRPYLMRLMGFGLRRPRRRVAGLDVAGTVAAVGASVTRFAVGDEVFGFSHGSFAEYAVAPEDKLATKPATLSFKQAAAVPVSGITALHAVLDTGRLTAGQRVLVVGASGGVGSYAVQIAKAAGAHVVGVCSTAKVELVRSLGADHVIDYTREDFTAGALRYDVVIDIGGNSRLSRLRSVLTPTGTLVMVGGESGGRWTGGFGRQLRAVLRSPFVSQRLTMQVPSEHFAGLERLAELIDAGSVTPSIERTYQLDGVAEAVTQVGAGRVHGKLVVTVGQRAE
jgi:NADPH:quinone reductase-like Zn-dependent oxidoreductase